MMVDPGLVASIDSAHERIAGLARRTPIERSVWLSEATGADVYYKLENLQLTGSFKVRGALNRVLGTGEADRRRGFVAASTGNHGAAVAHATALIEAALILFVPATADEDKVRHLEGLGLGVEVAGEDCVEAECAARKFAARSGAVYVSPYNDVEVIAGQGTVGRELAQQLPDLDVVFVALGGGGLISGCGAYLKSVRSETEIVACSPRNSAVMAASIAAGRILDLPSEPTLSDGTAGGVEADSVTFDLCRRLVDRYETVTETAIAGALRRHLATHHSLIEGAAAVPLAALADSGRRYAGRRVAVVLCGANIALSTLRDVLLGNGTESG